MSWLKAIDVAELADGGMRAVTLEGHELVVCRSGTFFAIDRRCGHMNAPLELGTLDGTIVTCPMHCAQFELGTGAVSCGPMPHAVGSPPPSVRAAQLQHDLLQMIAGVRTLPIRRYETKVEGGAVWVQLENGAEAHA